MLIDKPRFPIKELLLHGWLPSPLKKAFYRRLGYRIDRGVRLALGSVLLGTNVDIGADTEVGFFSFVRGRTIRIGANVQIGAASMIDTPYVEIGDGTKINEQVFIGGLQFPDSRLVIGRNCQIMQMTFVNPTRDPVEIRPRSAEVPDEKLDILFPEVSACLYAKTMHLLSRCRTDA